MHGCRQKTVGVPTLLVETSDIVLNVGQVQGVGNQLCVDKTSQTLAFCLKFQKLLVLRRSVDKYVT